MFISKIAQTYTRGIKQRINPIKQEAFDELKSAASLDQSDDEDPTKKHKVCEHEKEEDNVP